MRKNYNMIDLIDCLDFRNKTFKSPEKSEGKRAERFKISVDLFCHYARQNLTAPQKFFAFPK